MRLTTPACGCSHGVCGENSALFCNFNFSVVEYNKLNHFSCSHAMFCFSKKCCTVFLESAFRLN